LDANGSATKNDLLVVGVHLASGQNKAQNHNQAMQVLRERLNQALTNGTFPAGEKDILIAGDMNASRYDSAEEDFWDFSDATGLNLKTLSPENGEEYPGTRLAGVPLIPSSKIDYILFSNVSEGLSNDLVQNVAQVHQDLLPANFNDWRNHLSDHIPVTIKVRIVADDD
jgi:endonuclease/exonuclease/phosphatase family metal-dependent hydrolase